MKDIPEETAQKCNAKICKDFGHMSITCTKTACTKTRNNETKRPKRQKRNHRNDQTETTKMKTNTTNMISNDRNKTTCERKTELFYM